MRFIDLCAGIGGFRLALEQLGHECVFSCELDPDARACYEANFGGSVEAHDVMRLADLPAHDLLCCGFPCASFSRAGSMGCDMRLIRHVLSKLAPQTSQCVLLENTLNFPTVDGGRAMAEVLDLLQSQGFAHVQHRVVSLAPLTGLPQVRKRWICVAQRYAEPAYRFPDPLPKSQRLVLCDILLAQGKYLECSKIRRGGKPFVTDRVHRLWQVGCRGANKQNLRIYHRLGLGGTLTSRGAIYVWQDDSQVRLLTPRELARYMGFPDTFKIPSGRVVATKLLGRSIPPPLVRALMCQIQARLKL